MQVKNMPPLDKIKYKPLFPHLSMINPKKGEMKAEIKNGKPNIKLDRSQSNPNSS